MNVTKQKGTNKEDDLSKAPAEDRMPLNDITKYHALKNITNKR